MKYKYLLDTFGLPLTFSKKHTSMTFELSTNVFFLFKNKKCALQLIIKHLIFFNLCLKALVNKSLYISFLAKNKSGDHNSVRLGLKYLKIQDLKLYGNGI